MTHRVSGGDLLVGTDRAAARAWEVCLGTRRTNPDACSPDGRWVDSRSMSARWRVEQRPGGDVLRFDWLDESIGLAVSEEIAAEDDGLRLRFSARALGLASGIVAARFPIVAIDYQGQGGPAAELVLPRGNFGIQCRDCGAFAAMYPGIYQTMPWFGVLKAQAGLYLGAHDPRGAMKRVVVSGPRTPGYSFFEIYPEDSGAVGNAIEPDWSFDVTPVCAERGWPALAHHYKTWVSAQTEWGRAPLLRDRNDIPAAVRDGAWWFVHSIVPEAGIDLLEQGTLRWRKDFADLPTIHHWYEWHTPGMDRGFPTHRPSRGRRRRSPDFRRTR
ncbi:MAG: hypothetical protein IPK00_11905 [Deltaproteobacteria bacterium]|nr:hypothetical protein [Deltaproteobacteria bacterium]